MKGLKEAAPAELDAVVRRALRSQAMGRITPDDCQAVVSRVTAIKRFIENMDEEGGPE